ncbi:MAG: FAD-dependent oxidoreductase [Polyangiales bacterium]
MYDPAKTNGDTQSFWYTQLSAEDELLLHGSGSLTHARLDVDVVVIGAGIAGLSVAYHLCRAGRSVVVLDKGLIGSGETGRTTAHLSNALDEHYTQLEQTFGATGAQLAAASHTAAIADINQIVAAEAIACELQQVPGYLVSVAADEQQAHDELAEECEAARRAGIDVDLSREPKSPWTRSWHVCFPAQAQLQPLAYLLGLARAIQRLGGRIFTQARVTGVDELASPCVVHVGDSHKVLARDVVVAANTPFLDRFAMHTKQAAYRSYALALQLKQALPAALLWDTGDPYHYVRVAGADDVLIVGGGDHKVGQSDDAEGAWLALEAWARARFDDVGAVRARWSGQVQEPYDGLAFIGRNPGLSRHVYIATGDSGNGMTHGAIAGLMLRDLILDKPQPWARLYDPTRKPHNRAAAQFVRENANVAIHFAQALIPALSPSAPTARGTGHVVQRGLRKLAVYTNTDGQQHECSAVCPHLGCIVQWNSAELSWDCPCHGSRFDPYGRLLTGPALQDLALSGKSIDKRNQTMQRKLIKHLSHELWQTEVSASQHCRREAERLGDTPPARVLRAAAEHADSVLAELPKLELARPLALSGLGMAIGKLFSEARDTVADKLLTSERSYRGTLLGLRHGVDLVQLMRDAAESSGQPELTSFLDHWLSRRRPLVDAVAEELRWFATRADQAMAPARGLFSSKKRSASAEAAQS